LSLPPFLWRFDALTLDLELASATLAWCERIAAERNEAKHRRPFDGLARRIVSEIEIEPPDVSVGLLGNRRGEIQGDRVELVGLDAAPRAAPVGKRTEARLPAPLLNL
jgi:hypothetical protein